MHSLSVDESQSLCRKFECRKDIHYKSYMYIFTTLKIFYISETLFQGATEVFITNFFSVTIFNYISLQARI